jgi:hypothetical protein
VVVRFYKGMNKFKKAGHAELVSASHTLGIEHLDT